MIESPSGKHPYLLADYRESSSAPTVLMYGHGDVVEGMAGEWRDNLDPWRTTISGNRVYGRGTADNKGQHSINLSALRAVREARGGRLGCSAAELVPYRDEGVDRLASHRFVGLMVAELCTFEEIGEPAGRVIRDCIAGEGGVA